MQPMQLVLMFMTALPIDSNISLLLLATGFAIAESCDVHMTQGFCVVHLWAVLDLNAKHTCINITNKALCI